MTETPDRPYWQGIYRDHHTNQSGVANSHLVRAAADLPPGRALDAGCGEGADALWLASRGWEVTAVDFVATALDRARATAASLPEPVASRITWLEADLATWVPGTAAYDLVSSHYVHLPAAPRAALFRRLAEAVAPGGMLLIVGHDRSTMGTHAKRGSSPDLHDSAEEIAAALEDGLWEVEVAEPVERTASGGHGHGHGGHELDAVLHARRR